MKPTVVTAALLVYSTASNALTGDEFQRLCDSDRGYCQGYVQGVLDTRSSWAFAYERDPAHPREKGRSIANKSLVQAEGEKMHPRGLPWIPTRSCAPPWVAPTQLVEMTLRYLADHPEAVHDPADRLIGAAIVAAYPCP